MLQFLLDEPISPVIAREVAARCPGIKIVAFQHWRSGSFMGAADRVFLVEAVAEGLTLVSYDQKTIRPLLREWAEQGIDHTGLVFIDKDTIAPDNFGRLITALCDLWNAERNADWKNRVLFLRKP